MFWRILSAWHNPLAYLDTNLVSRSEIIFFGTPNRGYRYLSKSPATSSALIASRQGMNIAALLQSLSVIVRIVSYFPDCGNFVMKSIATVSNGKVCSGVMGIIAGFRGPVLTLLAGQVAQPLTYCSMSCFILGHHVSCLANR